MADYGIVDKFALNANVTDLHWLDDEKLWQCTIKYMAKGTGDLSQGDQQKIIDEHGIDSLYVGEEKVKSRVVFSAVGGLVEPREWPEDVAGRENFKGELFHSARWKQDVDLKDKDVVVVGTGCSAAQLVPQLTKEPFYARSVTQLMRSPPWVVPKLKEPFGKEKYAEYAGKVYGTVPGLARLMRTALFLGGEWDWFTLFQLTPWSQNKRKELQVALLAHMHETVPQKYHKMLTPDYEVACKRRIFDQDWFPGFNDPKVRLTTRKLVGIGEESVMLDANSGDFPDATDQEQAAEETTGKNELHADVIILANGFETTKWLHPIHVVGKQGAVLQDVWHERGGSQAYLGAAMDGFPNFFMIFGPNTATGHTSVIVATENMVNYAIKMIKPVLMGDAETVEVKKEAEVEYTRVLQKELKDTIFMGGGCVSWYFEKNGWNSTGYS